jgi:hypothetical protein
MKEVDEECGLRRSRGALRKPPNKQLQRTVKDEVPGHLGQGAAAELRR